MWPKKVLGVLILFLLLNIGFAIAEENETIKEKLDTAPSTLEKTLVSVQSFLTGALSWISLGFIGEIQEVEFATFLFGALIFMAVYEAAYVITKKSKLTFLASLIITIIAIIGMPPSTMTALYDYYKGTGIILTIIVPLLILDSFTYMRYRRAYEGKGASPFYVGLSNFIILGFFGVYFIGYGKTEEGILGTIRIITGWILVITGILHSWLYKVVLSLEAKARRSSIEEETERRTQRKETLDEIEEKRLRNYAGEE